MYYSTWDEVVIKVDDSFGYKHKIYTGVKVTVIGADVSDTMNEESDTVQYLCYVPHWLRLPVDFKTFTINRHHMTFYGFDPRFIGDQGCFITNKTPIMQHIPAPKGEKCEKCKTFFAGAQTDSSGVYRCRACKENPWR